MGVMFQMKGGNSEHLEMLKRKGISACARIANQMPLNKMSLLLLERVFRAALCQTVRLHSIDRANPAINWRHLAIRIEPESAV